MPSFTRNPDALEQENFDVLVIGAGIHGAGAAWDASLRGLKTALIDKGDFGAQTSAGCFKIVHGGLRYIQHFDLSRIRQSVREQRTLRYIAPHLIRPLPFLIPCYGRGMKSRPVLHAGLTLYDLLSIDRNRTIESADHQLPSHTLISKKECLQFAPLLEQQGLTGGVLYYDCQMVHCERLTLAVVQAAADAGARVVNYVEATGATSAGKDGAERLESITARDILSARELRITARQVVLACGPWNAFVAKTMLPALPAAQPKFSKGIQLVVPQVVSTCAVAVESRYKDPEAKVARGGRAFFIQPWQGCSLLGTTDTLYSGNPDAFEITRQDIQEFLADLQTAYPSQVFTEDQVQFAFGGLRPLSELWQDAAANGASGASKAARDDEITDYAVLQGKSRANNLLSVDAIKYTTFRAVAEKVIDSVCTKLGRKNLYSRTANTPVHGGGIREYGEFLTRLCNRNPAMPKELHQHLAANFGLAADDIYALIAREPHLAASITAKRRSIAAEVVHAVRSEMAVTLSDVIFRRSDLGMVGFPGLEALESTAAVMGRELGWDTSRKHEEIARCIAEFKKVSVLPADLSAAA